MLRILSDNKVTLKVSKCELDQAEVDLLGEVVSGTEIAIGGVIEKETTTDDGDQYCSMQEN